MKWFVTVLAMLLPMFAHADRFEPARAKIRDIMLEENLPSVALAVTQRGQIIWEEAYGWADVAKRVPATPRTPYSLASMSKPITATAIMMLVERGELNLDAPLNNYLGEHPIKAHVGNVKAATLRRVLDHTAGLPTHWRFFYDGDGAHLPSMERTIDEYGTLVRVPGEGYLYSNLGYGILGHVVERSAKRPFADFLRTEIFQPLGMTGSMMTSEARNDARVAVRYARNRVPVPFYDADTPGASSAYASAHDLALFGMFHLKNRVPGQKRILSDPSIDQMRVPTAKDGDRGMRTLGWGLRPFNGFEVLRHAGSMAGVASRLMLIPEYDVAIATMTNVETTKLEEINAAILQTLLPNEWVARRKLAPAAPVVGCWQGKAHVDARTVPLSVDIKATGMVEVKVGASSVASIPNAQFRVTDGRHELLIEDIAASLGSTDANRYDYRVSLDLTLRDGKLSGAAYAMSRPVADRIGSALSFRAELERLPAQE
ncbi:serine hydrolase domain-containing protein [Steroidobacter sp.]|uniref:serine hydrolase domain-containing protein n=1 Tax=Steroidobacter sp. TaxID=1978227 RepID=UPI001A6232CF|nr:serine hydrolase domain-containing protein [Steroidobacter sp.]MBL8268165.1 beta-lactamase family protein [Steroidobacter sp.]